MRKTLTAAIAAVSMFTGQSAAAAVIGAVDGSASSTFGGTTFYDIADTFNQNGLSENYVSGVTDFDAIRVVTYAAQIW